MGRVLVVVMGGRAKREVGKAGVEEHRYLLTCFSRSWHICPGRKEILLPSNLPALPLPHLFSLPHLSFANCSEYMQCCALETSRIETQMDLSPVSPWSHSWAQEGRGLWRSLQRKQSLMRV